MVSSNTVIMCKSFLQRVLSALWRRKSSALIAVMSLTVVLLLFQYHNVQHEGIDSNIPLKNHQRELHSLDNRRINVSGEVKEEAKLDRDVKADEFSINLQPNNNNNGEAVIESNDIAKAGGIKNEEVPAAVAPPNQLNGGVADYQQNSMLSPSFMNGNIHNFNKQSFDRQGGPSQPVYIPKHRLFHLDLKGAPPKVEYLNKLFPIMKQLGATGVLIEYEDMFPYERELAPMVAKNHYSKEDVAAILELSRKNDFEHIPLIQTFGHVEFILKNKDFSSLREVPNAPQAFCPSNNDTILLIQEMVDQMMALHPGVKWLHIGCDEVYQLGLCSKCSQRGMDEGRDSLFISHVSRVATYVRQRHNVIPIIWDDMLHHFTSDMMKRFELGKLVEPMVWTYVSDVYRFIPHEIWMMYGEVFPYVWAASAFKGAFGESLIVPPVKMHLENNLAWLDVMNREQFRFIEFRGLAITGWQRYDHFATLCELLPAAVPSLAVNMAAVSHGFFNESWRQELYDALGCMRSAKYAEFINLDKDMYLWDKMSWCFFPGVTFFKVTQRLEEVRRIVSNFVTDETVKKAWMNEYNVRHNYSSLSRIETSMANFPFTYSDVETLLRHARDTLREVFDEYVVAEWIEQNVYPLLKQLDRIKKSAEEMKAVDSWPVRPLDPIPELAKYGVGVPVDAKQEKK